ncbi:MAG: helicase-related protein [Mangrovibacterium sp.]
MNTIDNINTLFGDELKKDFQKGSKLRIAAASFSIYAYEALRKELQQVEELQFIFTSPTFVAEKFQPEAREFYIPNIFREANLCGGEYELRLKNELNQKAIAKECAEWVRQKAKFKSNNNSGKHLSSVLCVENGRNGSAAYTGFHDFTTADLGYTANNGFPKLIQKTENTDSVQFLNWFNQIWDSKDSMEEVSSQVLEYLETSYKENSPEYIYFITLYNIFNDFLEDLNADNLPNERTGFKNTVIWSKLYNFQQDAVIGAINKLEKYNGCIIADSVGLGKTFSALGVIKYYELRNKDVLVLCPKKLEANWNTYRHNDKDNLLAADRFNYEVLFHTDLSREKGQSNGRNLAKINWGNYGLVVIDESHNFRNGNGTSASENRYQKLMNKIVKEGIETKILMLSATPVNNRFNDLKNQLALAYEGHSAIMDEKLGTEKGIDQIFRSAQQAFNTWAKFDLKQRTSEKLLEMLDFDFFEMLDSLTIARSRKHITSYYDTSAIGQFPKRNKPISIQSQLSNDNSVSYDAIADTLMLLNLSVYSPMNYVLPSCVQKYADLYDKKVNAGASSFSQADRETSLKILMRMNLLKRIESSVHSFQLTVENIIEQIESALNLIARGAVSFEGKQLNEEDFDFENEQEELSFGKKVKVEIADMDMLRWQEDLDCDLALLRQLHDMVSPLSGNADCKLMRLKAQVEEKLNQPLNPHNKKVIIFTAFADTANYLYEQLAPFFNDKYAIHSVLITGSTRKSSAKQIPNDLNTLLSCFSPRSKSKALVYPEINGELDILIATDCISEGQNLQDADYLINYDIHWNPVRIIQRFGRIDRIGSINSNISMVNFWPNVELDAYINLKQRVENRMLISNMTSTGDDNILNTEERDLEYRKIQLQKLQDEVVDLEDIKEGISITDLGLNDFRIDLSNYIKTYGELKNVPSGLHTVVEASGQLERGAIFILKNINREINIDKKNQMHPYYMVYVKESGELQFGHLESKKILDTLRLLCKGKTKPLEEVCVQFNAETKDCREMTKYTKLLQKSIGSIVNAEASKVVSSLFSRGGTVSTNHAVKGIDDFTLISFVVVKGTSKN